ncbi:MAG: hypothetical protein IJN91_03900 [Alphaproteobacteria bacterium]|nr:hypothetical protein [Alphaproteobacteria bacterium]
MKKIINTLFVVVSGLVLSAGANALQFDYETVSVKLTGYGTVGMIEPDFESPLFIGDWRARGQITYAPDNEYKFGLVYAMDQSALEKGNFSRETFAFIESKTYGRLEVGFTDSIARKLGLGLPDVGGLRINDRPLYNEKIIPDGPIIADTTLTTGRSESLRINLVTAPISSVQYGISVAGITDNYDWSIDGGIKIKKSSGKLKTAYSIGASFMKNPNDFDNEVYTPGVTADWRTQMSLGMNLQYNSWILGTTARVIYDKNPIGPISDGFVVGTGVSYDLLKYSISLTYMFSDTGVWQHNIDDFTDNMAVASFRYKYSEFLDGWISGGITSKTPFISAGLRATF